MIKTMFLTLVYFYMFKYVAYAGYTDNPGILVAAIIFSFFMMVILFPVFKPLPIDEDNKEDLDDR